MSFNQVKSLFELNLQKKRAELRELEEKLRFSLYSYHTDVKNLLMERPEIGVRQKVILDTLKTVFRGKQFRIQPRILDYSHSPYPDYLSIFEYRPKSKTININYTLVIEHKCLYNGYNRYATAIEDRCGLIVPFTGEFKRLSLEWQANYKQFSEIEPKYRKLNEFEKNLDNNVNVFLLSHENPELYVEAEGYINNILNL